MQAAAEDPLLPHQEEGVEWLMKRKHALLADGMRVGKTRQAIEAAKRLGAQRVLVVCPSVVRINWGREFEKHWPSEVKPYVWLSAAPCGVRLRPSTPIHVVSYDLLLKNAVHSTLASIAWEVVILDEAHYCKNPEAKRTVAAYKLVKQARCWRLTGTPMPNHYGEMYPHAKTAGLWKGSYGGWIETFCRTYEDAYGLRIVGSKNAAELRTLLEPFMLRRKLEDVVTNLPPLLYETVVLEPTALDKLGLEAEDQQVVATQDRRLREIVTPDMPADMLTSLQPMAGVSRRIVGLRKVEPIVQLVSQELKEQQYQKIVIFAWHKDVITRLAIGLYKFHPVVITGEVGPKEREARLQTFRDTPSCQVFIGQITAAGVGIDISVAHEGLFAECSWVPGENAQAAMRMHHLKQTQPVRIRFVSAAGTVDEDVNEVLRRKTRDLTAVFDQGPETGQNPFS